jgi:hypothetical protein
MATNLALDDKLIEEARKLGKHKSKKAAVTAALEEYVQRRKQARIVEAFGTIDFDPSYDYKAERKRKRTVTLDPLSEAAMTAEERAEHKRPRKKLA